MSDIFLSYASEDRERVRPLVETLTAAGWSVFWDRNIPVGKTWRQVLAEALQTTSSIVIVWSRHAIESRWVSAEADEGLRLGLPLFPVLLDPVLPPLGFRDVQAADLSQWDGAPAAPIVQILLRSITSDLGQPAAPEPAPPGRKPPAPEPAPPEVKPGHLWVETEPPDAAVRILDQTEFSQGLELEPGSYEVEVSAAGYETKREKFELEAGKDQHIKIKLTKVKAHLWVETEPPEAAVRILNPPSEFSQGLELEPGKHEVEISADGYKTLRKVVELLAGEKKHLTIRLTALQPPSPLKPKPTAEIEAAPEKALTNSIGMKFVLIPAGTFQMGSPADEEGRYDNEQHHQVTLSQPIYLQTTPVTQGQWQKVMGNNPAGFKAGGADCPVEQVSWDDAQEFLGKLNLMEKTDTYRLPTEAEWEYACRAGSTTRFCFGSDAGKLQDYAWYDENSEKKTHPVGQKQPNAWGLYDMHGNVWEWCQDWYGDYPAGPVSDPQGPDAGEYRVFRGGSWGSNSTRYLRSANRYDNFPDARFNNTGFRVGRTFYLPLRP